MGTRAITKRDKNGRITKYKKYTGVSEFYSDSDHDKATIAHYIQYPDAYQPNKYIKERVETTDRDEALRILEERRSEVKRERNKIKSGQITLEDAKRRGQLTLNQMAKLYFGQRTHRTNNKNDHGRYNLHVSTAIIDENSSQDFGEYKVEKITTSEIQQLQTSLSQKNNPRTGRAYAPKYINDIIKALSAMFNEGIDQGWCSHNPVKTKKVKKLSENTEPGRVLTDAELDRLWKLEDLKNTPRLFLYAKLCYFTGARPDAVMDVQVKHVNFKEKKIRFKAMKGAKTYLQTVNDEVLTLIRSCINTHKLKPDHFLFFPRQTAARAKTKEDEEAAKRKSSNNSGYRRSMQSILNPVFNQDIDSYDVMYKITTYSLRRTSATKIYKAHGIIAAKKFLNHTDIKTTMKYLNVTDSEIDEAVNVL